MNVINYNPQPRVAENCGSSCMGRPLFPQQISLAMAYIPFQRWENIYPADAGFDRGTIFADLDKPFMGAQPNCK